MQNFITASRCSAAEVASFIAVFAKQTPVIMTSFKAGQRQGVVKSGSDYHVLKISRSSKGHHRRFFEDFCHFFIFVENWQILPKNVVEVL